MDFHEDFSDALRALIVEHFERRIENSGLDVDDFVDRVIDTIEDSTENLCDTIVDFVDSELGEE